MAEKVWWVVKEDLSVEPYVTDDGRRSDIRRHGSRLVALKAAQKAAYRRVDLLATEIARECRRIEGD